MFSNSLKKSIRSLNHRNFIVQHSLINRPLLNNTRRITPYSLITTRLIHLPQFPKHIPTKYELLMQARGFLQRLKIRIKYPLMKQMRPFTLNDITALFSWIFLGHTAWLLLGTTSFISLALWAANSLQFEEWVANRVGRYLTSNSVATVVFESAIPNWKDGKIRLNNLHVYCMPHSVQQEFRLGIQEREPKVVEGEPLAGVELDDDEKDQEKMRRMPWFDLSIDTIQVELNLMRLMEGKGIVKSAVIQGVRGIVDNRRGNWNANQPFDAEATRKSHIPSGIQVNGLSIDNLSVTVYMPTGFRPFPVSILQARLSRLRKQWLFYDILCADSIIGSFDTSIFSVHTPQTERSVLEYSDLEAKGSQPDLATYYPFKKLNPQGVLVGGENRQFGIMTDDAMKEQGYQRKSRLRIEGVSMDHIHRFGEGPQQWITSGTLDFCADIYIPDENRKSTSTSIPKAILELIKTSLPQSIILGTGTGKSMVLGEQSNDNKIDNDDEAEKFVMDIDVRFKNVKGIVPLKIPELSYMNSAMVRPVIAYINNNRTLVPIKGRIVMDLSLFNGAWTIQQSTLSNRLNESIAKGFVDLVTDHQERNRRLKQIGFWSFREMIRNIVILHDSLRGTARGFWTYLGQ